MIALQEVAEVMSAAAAAIPPTAPPVTPDPNAMYPKDWFTVFVGLAAGLGGAAIAGATQAWKAKHDVRIARDAALWEYHRVLTDISAQISAWHGDTVEAYDDGPIKERIGKAMKPAYPYFYLFPMLEQSKLKYPTMNANQQSEPHEDMKLIDDAIDALNRFLVPERKLGRRIRQLVGFPLDFTF